MRGTNLRNEKEANGGGFFPGGFSKLLAKSFCSSRINPVLQANGSSEFYNIMTYLGHFEASLFIASAAGASCQLMVVLLGRLNVLYNPIQQAGKAQDPTTMTSMVHYDLRNLIFERYRNPVFLSLATASSALAFGPGATMTPIILTLALLLVYSRFIFRSAPPLWVPHVGLLCALAVGASISRYQAALTALSAPAESITALFGSALILSISTWLTLYVDTKLYTHFKSSWAQITLFPALWATLWCTISRISPVGRLSTWSAADHSDAYNWIVPIAGPASKDWIIGAWAVVISQFIEAWYMGRPDEDLLLDNQLRRQQLGGSHFQVGILALCLSFATIPSFLIPQFPLLVSDTNVSTPLTVGCVLPSFQRYKHHVLTLDDFIDETDKVRSLARVILWPEGAVVFNNASERDEGLQLVREKFRGVYTGVSFEETIDDPRDLTGKTSIRRTGIAIVSKNSEPQIYYKRHLVPCE